MQHGAAIGALIATCFGLGWAIAGVQGLPSRWRLSMLGIAILLSLLISAGTLWRLRSHPRLVSGSGTFKGPIYWSSVAFETVAIFVAVLTLGWKGLKDYIMPTVAFIVGGHFFGLARAIVSSNRGFILVGAGMCVLAASSILGLRRSLISSPHSMALPVSAVLSFSGPRLCLHCFRVDAMREQV
jgi:hypothetical protein